MVKRYIVEVDGVPSSPSAISNAVVVGNQCSIDDQLSIGDKGACVLGTAREAVARAFGHVFRIAGVAGFTRFDIVYADLAFINLGDVGRDWTLRRTVSSRAPSGPHGLSGGKTPVGGKVKVQAVAAREPALPLRLTGLESVERPRRGVTAAGLAAQVDGWHQQQCLSVS